MNKLKNEMTWMKIQLNSSYGVEMTDSELTGMIGDTLYQDYINKKKKFYKVQKRVLKIKKLYGSI